VFVNLKVIDTVHKDFYKHVLNNVHNIQSCMESQVVSLCTLLFVEELMFFGTTYYLVVFYLT